MKTKKKNNLEIPVIRGVVLGVNVYRGFANISDLASLTKADIYDQKKNLLGTQRDLSKKHAREAYTYIKNKEFAFWPEVFLCKRDDRVMKFIPNGKKTPFGTLIIDRGVAETIDFIAISRVDGNHRLNYADGKNPKYPALNKKVSFCIAYDLSREEEISLFKDINDNQKKMNTNHLAKIQVRLTSKKALKTKNPALFIANKLGEDPKSPLYNRINFGSKKSDELDIQLGTLKTGLDYMLSKTIELQSLGIEGQYKEVRNYFTAIKKWQPIAWNKPKEYLMLRGSGLWAICYIGAHVIDKVLIADKYSAEDMLKILNSSSKKWNWSTKGDFKGRSSGSGAQIIAKKVIKSFESKKSNELYQQIYNQD